MTDDPLRMHVDGFVDTLNELVGGVLDTPARFEAWERMQARATARQFPEEAVEALEALGYSMTVPTADADI